MLSVVGDLQVDRWDVAAVFVEAAVIEPHSALGMISPVDFEDRLNQTAQAA